ncbi:MAG TPA: redoxin domain-containing protein, partial [Minicystis sp.]|nr:redoxin domain-containing protein [Minicystis sp.]
MGFSAPRLGELAPDFFARTTEGRGLWLSALRGKLVLLHFFADVTGPASDLEAKAFAEREPEIRTLGGEIIGVAPAGLEAVCRFAAAHGARFPLVPDERGEVARSYGVLDDQGRARATFLVDEAGSVALALGPEVIPIERVAMLVEALRERAYERTEQAPRSSLRSIPSRAGVVVAGRYR